MKQNMKKLWIALCMMFCLFALSGCSGAEEAAEEIDANVIEGMNNYVDYYVEFFASLTKEEVAAEMATCEKEKNYVMLTAFQSWDSVMDEMGNYIAYNPAVIEAMDDGYIARSTVVFDQRDMEFSIMLNEDGTEILGISFSPEYSLGEKMTKAGMNTIMGMGVVFVVLIFISWVISMFKYISVFENKMKEKKAAKTAAPAPVATPVPAAAPAPAAEPVVEDVSDDTELIAVIAAAIAAAEGKTSTNGLVVRSIKRVQKSTWK